MTRSLCMVTKYNRVYVSCLRTFDRRIRRRGEIIERYERETNLDAMGGESLRWSIDQEVDTFEVEADVPITTSIVFLTSRSPLVHGVSDSDDGLYCKLPVNRGACFGSYLAEEIGERRHGGELATARLEVSSTVVHGY